MQETGAQNPAPPATEPARQNPSPSSPLPSRVEEISPPCPEGESCAQPSWFLPGSGKSCCAWSCYGRAEAILWWVNHAPFPTLVTTGSAADPVPGALGQPGTRSVPGVEPSLDPRLGVRGTVGVWLGECQLFGIEGSGFYLPEHDGQAQVSSSEFSLLARPFLDVTPGSDLLNRENAALITFPGTTTGSILFSESSVLWGAQVNFLGRICNCDCFKLYSVLGGRYLALNEDLRINQETTIVAPISGLVGTHTNTLDQFTTQNKFWGGQVGFNGEFVWDRWFLNWTGKVGYGSMDQFVRVFGATSVAPAIGAPFNFPTGPLTLPTNVGEYHRQTIAMVGEVAINIGFRVTDHVQVTVGYTCLACNGVARPGDQIDRQINSTQIPTPFGPSPLAGAARPTFAFKDTDLWVQGFNCGLELRY
jgi:hypothetical protein